MSNTTKTPNAERLQICPRCHNDKNNNFVLRNYGGKNYGGKKGCVRLLVLCRLCGSKGFVTADEMVIYNLSTELKELRESKNITRKVCAHFYNVSMFDWCQFENINAPTDDIKKAIAWLQAHIHLLPQGFLSDSELFDLTFLTAKNTNEN